MPATLTQSIICPSASVTTVYTCSFASPPAPGSLVVVGVTGQLGIPSATTVTVTDNQGNTYTQIVNQRIAQQWTNIFACANVASSGTFTVTVTWNQPQAGNNMVLEEWAGMPNTLLVDGTSVGSGVNFGGAQSCGTLTTTNANDLLLAYIGSTANNPQNFSAPTGFTLDQSSTVANGSAFAHDVVSSLFGAVVAFSSTDTTGSWNGVAVALQIASATNQDLAASMNTMGGALATVTDYPLAASMSSFAGNLSVVTAAVLTASMASFSGALVSSLINSKLLAASMTQFAGALVAQAIKPLDASMASFSATLTAAEISIGTNFDASMAAFAATLLTSSSYAFAASMAPFSATLAIAVQHGPVPPTCEPAACDTTVTLISHIEVCENPGS